ncbi:matrixin family metalloprotease [Pendulispora brunnea]|uniref:Matrixin family metalloprotease n=1 Tax=Pendulispora brunnea TaxID=2905690 RepID=A0ABZ2KLE4_9BACT
MRSSIGVVGAAFAALMFSASNADAYCRTTTDGLISGCNVVGNQCCSVGRPLYWVSSCVGWSLQKNGTRQLPYNTVKSIIGGAFEKWSKVSCTRTSGTSKVTLNLVEQPDVDCSEVKYNKEAKNQNVIVFRDSNWDHTDSSNTLGLTTVVFDPNTGEIFDADMELNTADQTLSLDPVPPNGYDFESIITHEAGHFLGLAHSGDPEATMYAHYTPGSTKMRDLSTDDENGICSIYISATNDAKNGRRVTGDGGTYVPAGDCDPEARHGFSTACAEANPSNKGCSIGATGGGAGLFAAFGLVFSLGMARRARRGRRET